MPDFSSLPEVFVSDASLAAAVSREVKRGALRKLASRLYTRNLNDPPEQIVRRNLWPLIAAYLPGALIADRTALENRPAADGSVFLVAGHKRAIVLPGAVLRPRRGHPPLESDRPLIGGLRLASPARAFLENMRPSRARGGVARTLSKVEVEERLDEMLRRGGEAALQRLRDEARKTAVQLSLPGEFQRLDTLIGTLLGSRDTPLASPTAAARAAERPYDPQRLDLFQLLHAELARAAPVTRLERPTDGPALPFFEAYFSNFIEGTEFAVDEAADIVFKGHIRRARSADAHDVLGTWKVVSGKREMSRLPPKHRGTDGDSEQPSRAGYGGAPGARPWPIQDRCQSRRLHLLRRARAGGRDSGQRFRNLPQSRSPAPSRHLHDVPHLRGSSVRGRKWPRGPHHDECGTRGFGREPDRRANRLSQQLSDGVEGPLAEWHHRSCCADAGLRATLYLGRRLRGLEPGTLHLRKNKRLRRSQ